MNKEQLAENLNGRPYRNEITNEEAMWAKENNLVVVFGASDDLMEFRGAICDEVGTGKRTKVCINSDGILAPVCENGCECPYYEKEVQKSVKVEAIWSPERDGKAYASWLISTIIPHASFDIMEDGELYCRGLVFSLDDVK